MNPIDSLHLQLRLEGKTVVGKNRLRQVEELPGEEMPLLLIARWAGGESAVYYDERLEGSLQADLERLIRKSHFPRIDPLLAGLIRRDLPVEVGYYKTYSFPEHSIESRPFPEVLSLSREDPRVQAFGFGGFAGRVYAIARDGTLASACVSVRENDLCGEAWVFTDPAHRRQGLAQMVVGAWAQAMVQAGKIPFYSHKMENRASARLAARLELRQVFEEIVLSYRDV